MFALPGDDPHDVGQFVAAADGDAAFLRRCLNANNVNHVDWYGRTALYISARNGHVECLQVCLSLGGNAEVANLSGDVALHAAASNSHKPCVVLLLRQPHAHVDMGVKYTALSYLVQRHLDTFKPQSPQLDVIRVLLQRGAQISRFPSDWTPLPMWVQEEFSIASCYRIAVVVMAIHRHRRTRVTGSNGNDVMRLIGKHIWSTRSHDSWVENKKT
jgi:hypothetical protein